MLYVQCLVLGTQEILATAMMMMIIREGRKQATAWEFPQGHRNIRLRAI